MYKTIISAFILSLFLSSCNKEQDRFAIGKQHIGLLTDSTQVKDLEIVFADDSIVKLNNGDAFTGNANTLEIFEKGGKKLLTLSPKKAMDSTSTIGNIRILDDRYKTDENVSVTSRFKDISEHYNISRISNLINSVVVAVDPINASFTIDKNELPGNLRFDRNIKFESIHIPDNAKIKYFFINWNNK